MYLIQFLSCIENCIDFRVRSMASQLRNGLGRLLESYPEGRWLSKQVLAEQSYTTCPTTPRPTSLCFIHCHLEQRCDVPDVFKMAQVFIRYNLPGAVLYGAYGDRMDILKDRCCGLFQHN